MATITSAGSGLWSAAGTWDAGVPVDNDVVIIAAGHVVEFDVDQSGFANGIDGLTITGTLKLTRTAGTYYLKIKAAKTINGAGTFDCGTSVSPIPFTAKHTITGGAAWYLKGDDGAGLAMTIYAAEPTIKTIKLSGAEAIGQTELSVDTDVTGDIWAVGDTIRIDDIGISVAESEERVIAAGGIAAGAITVTAGLTAAKSTGAVVSLMSRNVKIIGSGNQYLFHTFQTGKLTFGGGQIIGSAYCIAYTCPSITISGGTFKGVNFTFGTCINLSISGGVFSGNPLLFNINCSGISISGGSFSGNTTVIAGNSNHVITGGVFSGNVNTILGSFVFISDAAFTGNYIAISNVVNGIVINCTFTGNNIGVFGGSVSIAGCEFASSTGGDLSNGVFRLVNNLLDSTTEYYNHTNPSKYFYSDSIDHDQVAGAYRAWTAGGITTKQAVTVPTGYSSAMQTVLESATKQGYWQKEITIGAGASVNIAMNLRKDAAMTYLPRVIVFNKASADPFAGGAGLYAFTMTDSIDTWEDDLYTYTNSTSEDITLVIRCQGMNATGNMYSALLIEQINVDLTGAIAKIDVIDGLVDAIKAKTDQLAFTVANQVDANALTGGGGATADAVADAVWDEAIADHAVGTTFGGKNQKVIPSESVNDYKADVSGLALEATLTAMKGAGWVDESLESIQAMNGLGFTAMSLEFDAIKGIGWGTETLKAIKDTIDALPAGISTADIMNTVVEGTFTLQDVLRVMVAALAGKLNGGGTGTLAFRDLSDTLDRIIADVDLATGDRDNITLDLT